MKNLITVPVHVPTTITASFRSPWLYLTSTKYTPTDYDTQFHINITLAQCEWELLRLRLNMGFPRVVGGITKGEYGYWLIYDYIGIHNTILHTEHSLNLNIMTKSGRLWNVTTHNTILLGFYFIHSKK